MKVTEEIFSFVLKRSAEEARYQRYGNFQAKGMLPDRIPESFVEDYKKRIHMLIVRLI
jgi:hypothetical protein